MSHTSAASEISAQVAAIRIAAERARERVVTIVDDDVVICVLRSEHPDPPAAQARRLAAERALAPALRAAVERTTGRTVATVDADCHVDPDITVLTFTFAPATLPDAG